MTSADELIRIWAAPDGSRAVLQYLPVAATREDVDFALKIKGVVSGILWESIDRALAEVSANKKPIENIEIAKAQSAEAIYTFCGKFFEGKEIEKYLSGLDDFGSALEGPEGRQAGAGGVFVCRGATFLHIELGSGGITIFGTPRNKTPLLSILTSHDESVSLRQYDNGADYVAKISGYLAHDRKKGFFIINPVIISPDNMRMDFILAPVSSGKEELIDLFFDKRFEKTLGAGHTVSLDREELASTIDHGSVSFIQLRRGRKPVPSRDAKLVLKIGAALSGNSDDSKKDGKIDYREKTPYYEVEQGTIIAEITPSLAGEPGVDVLGKEIAVDPAHEIDFKAGENVTVQERDGRLLYISDIAGAAMLTEDGVTVTPELKIQGDVGPETGNLRFGKNILVSGNITGGYKIVCGGDLEIRGNVENGAKIECKGNLTINIGLFGHDTQCIVRGNAQVGFLQESTLRVDGNLTIESYIYHSQVFCGGELQVRGARVTGEDRGAIIGGRVCSMKSMTVHSVGSSAIKTELLCGVDSEAQAALMQAKNAEPVLTRKIQTLQSSLGINIQDADAVEKLRSMPTTFKTRLKERITELKELIRNRDAIIQALPQLEQKAFSPDAEKLSIKIQSHLTPDVFVRIGNASKLYVEASDRTKFKMDEGRIVELSAR